MNTFVHEVMSPIKIDSFAWFFRIAIIAILKLIYTSVAKLIFKNITSIYIPTDFMWSTTLLIYLGFFFNINVWLPLQHPPPGSWTAIQACTLTRNRTGNPLVHRTALHPLSHTRQGYLVIFLKCILKCFIEGIMLNEVSQSEKDKYCMISYVESNE